MVLRWINGEVLSDLIECTRAPVQKHTDCVVAMAIYSGDHPDWINTAVKSILTQSFGDFVFLILIDGPVSQEVRCALMNAISGDDRVGVFECKQNLGLSTAMNYAIDWSKSLQPLYFFRMDADDISHSERLQTQIDYLSSNKDVDILGTSLFEIDEEGQKVGKRVLPRKHEKIKKMIFTRCPLNHPTVCIRYNVFASGLRYDESLKNTQDYFFWITLMKAGFRFANLKKPLLDFRRVNNFYKRRGFSKSLNEFKARRTAMKEMNKYRLRYIFYALSVLAIRMMPSPMIRLAYAIDRIILRH